MPQRRKPNLQTQDFVVLFGGYTTMKLDREPFKDVRVRRALALASSWKEILETNAWSQGHAVPNATIPAARRNWAIPIDQLTPEGRRLYEQNIPEARRLLTQAGLPSGVKVPVEAGPRGGQPLPEGASVDYPPTKWLLRSHVGRTHLRVGSRWPCSSSQMGGAMPAGLGVDEPNAAGYDSAART